MPADKDVLGQADALLRRHAMGTIGTATDAHGVPVLTEMIGAPQPPEDESAVLAREVFDRVMGEVEGRLAAELERRLVEHLHSEVSAAVASALGDLHQDLANTIGDAIKEALQRRQQG
jgi:hypothetical protein